MIKKILNVNINIWRKLCAERFTDEICRRKKSADFAKLSHTVIQDHW